MHTLYGQLILRKISELDASSCQILRLKCTKFDYCEPQTPLGDLTALGPTTPRCIQGGLLLRQGEGGGEVGLAGPMSNCFLCTGMITH